MSSTRQLTRALTAGVLLACLLALAPSLTVPASAADASTGSPHEAAAGTGDASPATAASGTAVMRGPRVDAAQLAAWFRAHEPSGSTYRASVPVDELARLYLEEGRAEGVAGDVAFIQGVLETGWFRWPAGQVTPAHNNFAGIGACDGGTCTVARFPDARIGVRAQIQHLRAYADPTVTEARLANPLESPRFHLVTPKGMAPYWEQFGGGVWATDPAYATKILDRYAGLLSHAGVRGGLGASRVFSDVPSSHTHATAITAMADLGVTRGCGDGTRFCPGSTVTRDQMATFLVRAFDLPAGRSGTFRDVAGVHAPATDGLTRGQMASLLARTLELPAGSGGFRDVPAGHAHGGAIAAIADAGITNGCARGRFCPDETVSRAQMAAFLDRALALG